LIPSKWAGECGTSLNGTLRDADESRKLCSFCDSPFARINLAVSDSLEFHSKLKLTGKRPGVKRPFIEQIVGDDFHWETSRWMKLKRVFDRLRNWYSERVVDPESGQVVHSCEEPLSEHHGHGSDRQLIDH